MRQMAVEQRWEEEHIVPDSQQHNSDLAVADRTLVAHSWEVVGIVAVLLILSY